MLYLFLQVNNGGRTETGWVWVVIHIYDLSTAGCSDNVSHLLQEEGLSFLCVVKWTRSTKDKMAKIHTPSLCALYQLKLSLLPKPGSECCRCHRYPDRYLQSWALLRKSWTQSVVSWIQELCWDLESELVYSARHAACREYRRSLHPPSFTAVMTGPHAYSDASPEILHLDGE